MAMKVHILYVGRGDSIIIESSNNRLVMIDSHKTANSTDPIEYLKANFNSKPLDIFILTHPHHHRLTGLARLRRDFGFREFWDTNHNFTMENLTKNFKLNSSKDDWTEYLHIRAGKFPEIKVSQLRRGDKITLAEGEEIEVLAPTDELQKKALATGDYHYSSYVLRVKCLNHQTILGGSANAEVWEDILNAYGDTLKAGLLVASHHGHRDSFHKQAVKTIDPEFVVVSSEEESYADAAGLYGRYSRGVVSTAHLGDVVASCYPSGGVELKTQY